MHNENWDDLRFVLAVAESGTVSAAAKALGVNHATVLRRVAAFEERHGVSVFEKGVKGYTISPDKMRIIEAAREVEVAIGAVERLLNSGRGARTGKIRLTSTDTFTQFILPPVIQKLTAAERGLHFELLTTSHHLDFARLHADVTVRPAARLPDDLQGDVAAHLGFAVYGRGADLPWYGLIGPLSRAKPAAWMQEHVPASDVEGNADSFPTLARLVAQGLCKAFLPCCLGDMLDGVSRVSGMPVDMSIPVWVACHADLAGAPRLRHVRRSLVEALGEISADLRGGQ